MKKIFLSLMLVMFSTLLFSQDIYSPDRPGYTYNSHSVGLHQMDLEVGFGYNYFNCGEKSNLLYNTTAIRYGAFKFLEFRYQMDFGNISTPTINQIGLKGICVGAKIPIYINDTVISIALVGSSYLPNLGFNIPNYSPSVTLVLQKSFGKFSLMGNSSIFWDGFNPWAQGSSSLALYYFPSKFGFFVETFCLYSLPTMEDGFFVPSKHSQSSLNCGDIGILYNITDNFIIDLSAGLNYTKGFDNSFVNCGLAWRIPNKNK